MDEREKKITDEVKEGAEAETRAAEDVAVDAGVDSEVEGKDMEFKEEVDEDLEAPVSEEETAESEEEQSTPEETPAEEVKETTAEEVKQFTQSQVNELVGRARAEGRERAMKELLNRYGVNNDTEMNDIFGKGQGYELLNDELSGLNTRYKELAEENALLRSKVVSSRYDDVKAILKAKGMDVTVENIESESLTHPEWVNSNGTGNEKNVKELSPEMAEGMAEANKPGKINVEGNNSRIKSLGNNIPEAKEENSEDERAMRYFNL